MNPSKDPVAPSRPDLNETTIGAGGHPDTVSVRAIQTENKARMCVYVTERWTPSPEERKRIAEGADVYLTLVTGDGSPMPVQLDAGEPEWLIYGAQPGCCERHVRHVQRNHIIYEGDDALTPDLLKAQAAGGTQTEDSRTPSFPAKATRYDAESYVRCLRCGKVLEEGQAVDRFEGGGVAHQTCPQTVAVIVPQSSAVDRPAPFPCPQCQGVLLAAGRRLWCVGKARASYDQADKYPACGYQTEGVEAHNVSPRCPKDGAQLLTDGLIVWCSNVDSRTPCDYFSA